MIEVKCNRCGRTAPIGLSGKFLSLHTKTVPDPQARGGDGGPGHYVGDLCDDCMSALTKFLTPVVTR